MTSFWTTGGIRGGKAVMEKFCPRTFNMGFSKEVYEKVGDFKDMMGEDIDLSIRIRNAGFSTRLIREVYVYHKRRIDMHRFYKQVNNFGQARIWLQLIHPGSLKPVHAAPALMLLMGVVLLVLAVFCPWLLMLPLLYILLIFFDSLQKNRSIRVAALSVLAAAVQITGYGMGFLKAFWFKMILRRPLETKENLTKLYNRG
jgi:GT2 family glycosyltransferase